MSFKKILGVAGFFILAIAISLSRSAASEAQGISISADGFAISNNAYSLVDGQPTASGSFANGNVGAYPVSACVPVNAVVKNTDNANSDITFRIDYDYHHQGKAVDAVGIENLEQIVSSLVGNPNAAGNLNEFNFTNSPFSSTIFFSSLGIINAQISGPFSGKNNEDLETTAGDDIRHYNITLVNVAPSESVYVLFCGRLGPDASHFPGASMQITPGNGGGKISIFPSDLIPGPSVVATSTLIVINKVINNTGTLQPEDFITGVAGANASPASFAGSSSGTMVQVDADSQYSVDEPDSRGYTKTLTGDCTGTIAAGETKTCTITNDDKAATTTTSTTGSGDNGGGDNGGGNATTTTGTLVIKTNVLNDNGHDTTPSDFIVNLTGTNLSTSSFPGSSDGIAVVLDSGAYSVSQTTSSRYITSFDDGCSGTLTAGETKTCTITNDDLQLLISNEAISLYGGSGVEITWDTNFDATSRVVFGTSSTAELSLREGNYGYSDTTAEDQNFVYHHSVFITGIAPGTRYYFRPISHGSPEVLGNELSFLIGGSGSGPAGGSGSTSGGGYSSGGTSSGSGSSLLINNNPATISPPQAVLGEKITDQSDPALEAPQAVLGYKTLPDTGTDTTNGNQTYYLLSIISLIGGLFLIKKYQP